MFGELTNPLPFIGAAYFIGFLAFCGFLVFLLTQHRKLASRIRVVEIPGKNQAREVKS